MHIYPTPPPERCVAFRNPLVCIPPYQPNPTPFSSTPHQPNPTLLHPSHPLSSSQNPPSTTTSTPPHSKSQTTKIHDKRKPRRDGFPSQKTKVTIFFGGVFFGSRLLYAHLQKTTFPNSPDPHCFVRWFIRLSLWESISFRCHGKFLLDIFPPPPVRAGWLFFLLEFLVARFFLNVVILYIPFMPTSFFPSLFFLTFFPIPLFPPLENLRLINTLPSSI